MLREQGTPSDVGTADVTSVHEVALIGLTPAGTTLTMPSVEAAPGPTRMAGEPRTSAAGTRPDPVAWL
ncbi:MAG TPA: hypothetical protein VG123_35275, partial [Streptosporangiaceae bacterium]|nr:hypothetical protein [Streptosporangiaceae bacterium]